MRTIVPLHRCPYVKGRIQGSLECANCMYNRVIEPIRFATASNEPVKTRGSRCVADEYMPIQTIKKEKK